VCAETWSFDCPETAIFQAPHHEVQEVGKLLADAVPEIPYGRHRRPYASVDQR
jgi:hypothetical protein